MEVEMTNEVIEHKPSEHALLPVADILRQAQQIQQLLSTVMQKGTHYDVIPGTKTTTLLKAGAEKILSLFRIGIRPQINDQSSKDEIRYRVVLEGFYIPTGATVGFGMGECSTGEEKYKWREAVCPAEFEAAPPDRKRIKWKSGWGKKQGERVIKEVQQVRTEPADLANTVLKMAKKRAMTDLCLTATAASDAFAQDLEDLDETLREHLVKTEEETEQKKPEPKELPPCPQAKLDNWIETVQSGKQTAEALMAFATAKHTLTAAQIVQIEALKKPPEKVDDEWTVDYATGELNP